MNLHIEIFKGDSFTRLLKDGAFIARWTELANQDPKITVIQEPPYVLTWYQEYSNKYQPVLILGFDHDQNIVGLMPLAFSLKDHYLTHAGDHQAEYHGWICEKSVDQIFPIQALIAVRHNFQLKKWKWRWIPPKSQVNWTYSRALTKEHIYMKIIEQDSPILDLKDENKIQQLKNNKSFKNKINRYKKKNSFYIERIKSKDKAKELFDILANQCDFRQMAVNQVAPFISDPNKKKFFIERLNFPENNHFTILWSGNDPVAYHFGACDSDTVYWGLTGYDPLEEKNSPGSILIIYLIDLLREEGYHYLDLTPGKDRYKQRFSNLQQRLYQPTVYFSKRDKLIADLNYFFKNTISNAVILVGADPKLVKKKLHDILEVIKKSPKGTLVIILRGLIEIFYKKSIFNLYKFDTEKFSGYNDQTKNSIRINSYPDLLLYNDTDPLITKTDILSKALRHFSLGELLYTSVENGLLAHFGWMIKGGGKLRHPVLEKEIELHTNSILLHSFYTHPNFGSNDFYSNILESLLFECKKDDIKEVFIWTSAKNIPFDGEFENTGFNINRRFQRIRILWAVNTKELKS